MLRKVQGGSFVIALFCFLLESGVAESVWIKYGNEVLRGVGDARAVALSEAYAASATGPLSILWNPARLASAHDRVIVYTHQERFAGNVNLDIVGFDLKDSFKSKWSFVLIRESVQGIPNTLNALYEPDAAFRNDSLDSENERILADSVTFFNQVEWAGMLGFATSKGRWHFGGDVKGLIHRLGSRSGYGIGFDFGTYRHLSDTNVLGFAIKDVTTSWVIWESGTVERIAPQVVVGDVQTIPLDGLNLRIRLMTNLALNVAGKGSSDDFSLGSMGGDVRLALEACYKGKLHLRLGRNPITEHSFGVGMAFSFGALDYAFTPSPIGSILGGNHLISLTLKLSHFRSLREKLSVRL